MYEWIAAGGVIVVLAGLVVYLVVHTRRLSVELAAKRAEVDATSRTLIEKHMELMDNNRRLQRMLQSKTEFVSIASHQLRTPLADMKWGLSYLLDGAYGEVTETEHTHLQKLAANTDRMNHLIDELLNFVASEAGTSDRKQEPTNLEALIEKVIAHAREHFSDRSLGVSCEFAFGGDPVLIDPGLIEIAFVNLIHNAYHYTPDGKHITIKTARQGDNFYFAVEDEGVGIPEDKQRHVFGKFKRSPDAMHLNEMGIGLGLYITKNIVEKCGGEIGFSSEGQDKGSTFYFTIPVGGE